MSRDGVPDQTALTVYFDGLCEPINPDGVATYGYIIYEDGKKLRENWAFVAEGEGASNNLTQYAGEVAALEWLVANGYRQRKVEVRGDSRHVVN